MEKVSSHINHLRNAMRSDGLDALIIRDIRDLRWTTGFQHVFDSEEAHTAIVTFDDLVIHTDSRYSSAMRAAAFASSMLWSVDDATESAGTFSARYLADRGLDAARIGIDTGTSLALFRTFETALGNAQLVELESIPLRLRAKKDSCEIDALKQAQKIAEDAFLETLGNLRVGQTEREISLALEFAFRSHGADGCSFPSIVASGPNGANPHSIPSDRCIQENDLIVCDFGVELDGYCSDTTRVICAGNPSKEQRLAYDAVRRANETVEEAIRPGVTGKEMHELAMSVLDKEGFGDLMGHGLGHGVGLAIHEQPNLNMRNANPLVEGNVVTIEPGVYLNGKFGIRLEDCGVITAHGFENFCTLPHDLLQIG